jgi:hypothetical protein
VGAAACACAPLAGQQRAVDGVAAELLPVCGDDLQLKSLRKPSLNNSLKSMWWLGLAGAPSAASAGPGAATPVAGGAGRSACELGAGSGASVQFQFEQ